MGAERGESIRPSAAVAPLAAVARTSAAVAPLAAVAVLLVAAAPASSQEEHPGKAPYDRWCAGCHGIEGDGDGPAAAWMLPRPRDFRPALYQVRTTASGQIPTDADILRVIDEGMPGTAMPGWKAHLSQGERDALVDYLKTFSRFFESEGTPEPLALGSAPRTTDEAIENGRELYQRIECWKCHGQEGRGDGSSAPTQTDDDDYPIRPADLTENWYFNGGGSLEAIYTRLRTGMDGTPMPSFSDLIESGVATDEDLWHLAMYVRSLSPEEPPEVRDVVRAALVESLPGAPDDSAWDALPRYYVPMVGQIIEKPRWFAPTVDGIWVQAAHDGRELALRLVWHDPSESPDPAWGTWRQLVGGAMEPTDEGALPEGPVPDVVTVQWPTRLPEGRDLPFFLGGDARDPVYLWTWSSAGGVEESRARGLGNTQPLEAAARSLDGEAAFDQGEWRLVLRRALAATDPEQQLTMAPGQPIPLAFFAQDGDNGEAGARGSVSSWYYVWLDEPVPTKVYTLPLAVMVLTALLGLFVVRRAQRETRRTPSPRAKTIPEGA